MTATTLPAAPAKPALGAREWTRRIVYWIATAVIAIELASGAVWNMYPIAWIEAQLDRLGYPLYFAYILAFWQAAAVVAIFAPKLSRLKECAYAGCFFLWTGAVISHLASDNGLTLWGWPALLTTLTVVSWALRPADHRQPQPQWETRPRAWVVPVLLIAGCFAFAFATLSASDATFYQRAVDLGWID